MTPAGPDVRFKKLDSGLSGAGSRPLPFTLEIFGMRPTAVSTPEGNGRPQSVVRRVNPTFRSLYEANLGLSCVSPRSCDPCAGRFHLLPASQNSRSTSCRHREPPRDIPGREPGAGWGR